MPHFDTGIYFTVFKGQKVVANA